MIIGRSVTGAQHRKLIELLHTESDRKSAEATLEEWDRNIPDLQLKLALLIKGLKAIGHQCTILRANLYELHYEAGNTIFHFRLI